MAEKRKILLVEDMPTDADLAQREIRSTIPDCEFFKVETRKEFLDALEDFSPDLILSDYRLPRFDGMTALKIAREKSPDIPFIIITGSQNEETAVECMRAGAWNYVIKERLKRLGPAIQSAFEEKTLRAEKRKIEAALRASEAQSRAIMDSIGANIAVLDKDGVVIAVNENWRRFSSENGAEKNPGATDIGVNYLTVCRNAKGKDAENAGEAARGIEAILKGESSRFILEYPCHSPNQERWFLVTAQPLQTASGGAVVSHIDITERKKAELERLKDEEQLRALFEILPTGISILDTEGKIESQNPALGRILRLTKSELDGQAYRHRHYLRGDGTPMPPEEFPSNRALAKMSAVEETEIGVVLESGGTIWTSVSAAPLRHPKPGVVLVTSDTTERKKMVLALAESEERFRRIVEQTVDGIVLVGEDGLVLEWNPATEKQTGISREKAIGKPVWDLQYQMLPESRKEQTSKEKVKGVMEALLHTGKSPLVGHRINVVIQHADGSTHVLEQDIFLIRTAKGFRIGTSTRDVTEQKSIEAALRESEAKFRGVVEHSPDGYEMIDYDGRYADVNEATCRQLGYSRAELLSRTIQEIDPEFPLERFRRTFEDMKGKGPSRFETVHRKKDGSFFPVEIVATVQTILGVEYSLAFVRDITDRKRADEALRESETRYRALVTTSPDAITVTNREGKVVMCNAQTAKMHGYASVEDVIGRSAFDLIAPESHPLANANLHRTMAEGMVRNMQYPLLRKDGSRFIGELSTSVIRDEKGEPILFIGISRDISERIRVQQRIAESESLYRTLLETSPDAITLADMEGKITLANRQTARIHGYDSPSEMIGLQSVDLIAPENREKAQASFQQVLDAGVVHDIEYVAMRKDGSKFPLDLSAAVLPDAEGKPKGFIAVTRDFTDRKEAEAALRRSEQRFRALIEKGYDIIVLLDGAGKILYQSPSGFRLSGYSEEERLGQDGFELIHPDDQAEVSRMFTELLQNPGSAISLMMRNSTKTGGYRWIEGIATNLLLDPDIRAIVVNYRDVTERVAAEEKNRLLNEELDKRVQDRTRELAALYEVARIGNEEEILGPYLRRVLQLTLQTVGFPAGAVFLLEKEERAFRLSTAEGISPEEMADIAEIPMGEGIIGAVGRSAEPAAILDLRNDLKNKANPFPGDFSVFYGMPILAEGKVNGVFAVLGELGQFLNAESLALLSTVADQIGETVEKERLRGLAAQTALLEERQRLARELHDSLTQSMYAIANFASAMKAQIKNGNLARMEDQVEKCDQLARQALRELRLVLFELRPATLGEGGFLAALRDRLDIVEKHAGVGTHLEVELAEALPPECERELYGIAVEALNNALRHAEATNVSIRLQGDAERVTLEVRDDGKGFTSETGEKARGMGFSSMKERCKKIHGAFAIDSSPGRGTCIRVELPYPCSRENA